MKKFTIVFFLVIAFLLIFAKSIDVDVDTNSSSIEVESFEEVKQRFIQISKEMVNAKERFYPCESGVGEVECLMEKLAYCSMKVVNLQIQIEEDAKIIDLAKDTILSFTGNEKKLY